VSDEAKATRRWLYVWIAIGVVVMVTVSVFLIAISNSLRSIDRGLDRTQAPVSGVRSDVDPLPADIDRVNDALAQIRTQLKPLPGQARTVGDNLGAIDTSLVQGEGALAHTADTLDHTDGALASTSRELSTTSGRLLDTASTLSATQKSLADVAGTLSTLSDTLSTTLTLTGAIEQRLVAAQRPRSDGTGAIWRHVQVLNGGRFAPGGPINSRGLPAVESDARQTNVALVQVNAHLQSICESVPLTSLAQLGAGASTPPDPSAPARC
jgi:hypothetical protein